MRLKRALLIPVILGLVAYGALKGAVYYQVRGELERLGKLVAPFAAFKYQGIASSLKGSVAVTGITLTPADAPVGLRIERLELQGEGTRFLFGLLDGFQADQLPARLRLSVRRVRMPLGGGYLNYWIPNGTAAAPDLCTLGGLVGQTGIERLGFRQRVADARLRYDYDRRAGTLDLLLDYTQDGLAAMSVEMSLADIPAPAATTAPKLERFSLLYRIDPGYMRDAVAYCAREAGVDSNAFIDRLFTGRPADYVNQLGFIPGEGLQAALRRLVNRPGDLLLTAVPGDRFNPARLQEYRPEELIRELGVGLSVNDQPVTDLSFRLPRRSESLAGLLGADPSGTAVDKTPAGAASPGRSRARFTETPVEQLSRHIGSRVRVYGSDRAEPQQGVLAALRNQQLELEQRLYGGKMTLYIPLEKVRRAEVLRRQSVERAAPAR